MDPINTKEKNELNETATDQLLYKLSASCTSLTNYENTSLKCLLPQVVAALVAATVFLATGSTMAYSSLLISHLSQNDSEIKATNSEKSFIASIILIAVPPGSLLAGIMMDTVGRLNLIKLSCIPAVLGWIITYCAKSVNALVIARVLLGLSFSLGINPCMVYITEISSPYIRMSLLSITDPYGSLGMISMFFAGWILDWRNLIWVGVFFAVMPSLLCYLIPESPSLLVLKGNTGKAGESLRWIHQNQDHIEGRNESFAELSLKLLQNQNKTEVDTVPKKENGFKASVVKLLEPVAYRPIIIMSGLFFFTNFAGMVITGPFTITFIKECGTDINAYFLSILIEFARFVMSLINLYTLKTFKRRTLLTISGLGMASCMFIGGLYTMWIKEGSTNQTWVPACSLLLYNILSVLGFTSIPLKFIGEFLPIEIRGVGYSIIDCIFCAFMVMSIETYYFLNDFFGGEAKLQWFFASVSLVGVLYCYIFIPETKDKKLTEISDYFKKSWIYRGQLEQTDRISTKEKY